MDIFIHIRHVNLNIKRVDVGVQLVHSLINLLVQNYKKYGATDETKNWQTISL
jgi:hypothetical protein